MQAGGKVNPYRPVSGDTKRAFLNGRGDYRIDFNVGKSSKNVGRLYKDNTCNVVCPLVMRTQKMTINNCV